VDDEADVPGPHVLGDRGAQHRCDDQLGAVTADRLPYGVVVPSAHRVQLVAEVGQFGVNTLGETVERTGHEQDSHRTLPGPSAGSLPPAQQPRTLSGGAAAGPAQGGV
jgi:hypothetical protein